MPLPLIHLETVNFFKGFDWFVTSIGLGCHLSDEQQLAFWCNTLHLDEKLKKLLQI